MMGKRFSPLPPRSLEGVQLRRSHWLMLAGIFVGLALILSSAFQPGTDSRRPATAPSTLAVAVPTPTSAVALVSRSAETGVGTDGRLVLPSYTPESSGVPLAAEPDWSSLLLDLGGKLLLTLALVYASLYLLRKYSGRAGGQRQQSKLDIVATLQMGQHRSLHIVRVGDRQLLVGMTPSQISFIADVSNVADDLRASPAPQGPNGSILDRLASFATTGATVERSARM